jgi:hypothetical protein
MAAHDNNPGAVKHAPTGLLAIFYAGLLCGALDIIAACINAYLVAGVTPEHVLQSVAGGLLGRGSYQGGIATAAIGLALQFTMALIVAAVFYVIVRRFALPGRYWAVVALGMSYGAAVFVVNNFGTAPLMSWVRSLYLHTAMSFKPPMGWSQLIIHMLCVGLPIALVMRRYLERR